MRAFDGISMELIIVFPRQTHSRTFRESAVSRASVECQTQRSGVVSQPTSRRGDVVAPPKCVWCYVLQAVEPACGAAHERGAIGRGPAGRKRDRCRVPALVRCGKLENRPIAAPHQSLRAESFTKKVEVFA